MTSAKGYCAAGIDLGGTSVKYALVGSEGGILFDGSLPTADCTSADEILERICTGIGECVQAASERGLTMTGIGIGTPGVVSADGRTVLGGAENLAGWIMIPLADRIEERFGLRCAACNDADAMAFGERMFGAARNADNVMFVTVGTGIGCSMVIDGRPFRGFDGKGMEMGHITVKCDGEQCACGGRGCLEHYASTAALVRSYARETGRSDADGRTIVKRYLESEPAAVKVMEEHWHYLSHGIASMINIFAPQLIVVGGGISESGDFYIERLREYVSRQRMEACGAHTEITAALLGNRAGVLGAAGLAFEKFLTE